MKSRIAVLASGGGSNLQAIIEHLDRLEGRRGGDVAVVMSDRPRAGALERARERGIATVFLEARGDTEAAALDEVLATHDVDLIVLAGYLRLVPAEIVAKYHGRIINIHPALLPAFGGPGMYGAHVHRAVLDAGVRVTGVTAHFVDERYDRGRIIAQWPVPVFPGDDVAALAARVLRVEHLVYPRVVDAVAGGRMSLESCGAMAGTGAVDARPSFTLLPHDDARLTENIDLALGC